MQEKIQQFIKNKKVIIFGGTGSWGSELVRQMVEKYQPSEIRIFCRGEHKQVDMRYKYQDKKNIKFIIGDVRDEQRVEYAMKGVDIAFNLAALKHVPVCEENVWEAIKTNIHGIHNIINAALQNGTESVVQVSTDKAVDPLNLYGFTKGCAEKLITSANNSPAKLGKIKFVCVRGGNVLSTAGSVVPLFIGQIRKDNKLTLTDEKMSRYIMRVEQAIQLVLKAAVESIGGEIFVMKMPGIKVMDLAQVIKSKLGNKDTKIEKIGVRPGEKLYEVLISKNESPRTVQDGEYYIIMPDVYHKDFNSDKYKNYNKIEFEEYNSKNTHQLNQEEILKLLDEDGWLDADKLEQISSLEIPKS